VLAQIVRDGIEELLDPGLQEATLEREEVERESLAEDVATIRRQQERNR
jgi:siroheme synthase (precorrin-2 oxidase/ferrochelatase)